MTRDYSIDNAAGEHRQLRLAFDQAPEAVREHGLRAPPPRLLASMDRRPGRPMTSQRMSPRIAWRFLEVEYGQAMRLWSSIGTTRNWGDARHPWNEIRRRHHDHAPIVWCLENPVHRHLRARRVPLR